MSEDRRPAVAPKYVDGREIAVPRSNVTAAQINIENKVFWELQALRERVEENPNLTQHERNLILANGETTIRHRLAEPARLINATDAARRVNGSKRSAENRKNAARDRNREIHDLHIGGKTAFVIGKKFGIGAPQVRRILQKPRP